MKEIKPAPKTIVQIPALDVELEGILDIPPMARDIVIFSHDTGSDDRFSPKNNMVAEALNKAHHGTLLLDLLTEQENRNSDKPYQIELLTMRLVATSVWLSELENTKGMNIGYFGSGTGTAVALKAAAYLGKNMIKAIVSRGGRPDLAQQVLHKIKTPTLLIVAGGDIKVIEYNQQAFKALTAEKRLDLIDGNNYLFDEPGKLQKATTLTIEWYDKYLTAL